MRRIQKGKKILFKADSQQKMNGKAEKACSADSILLAYLGAKSSQFAFETIVLGVEMSIRRPNDMNEGTKAAKRNSQNSVE